MPQSGPEQNRAAPPAIHPGTSEEAYEEKGGKLGRAQKAHLGGGRVQERDRGQWEGDPRDFCPDEGDGLAGPQLQKAGVRP